ncbi:hypothetical protein BH11GEM2_BH11GEM2_21850 [soil metagenome]
MTLRPVLLAIWMIVAVGSSAHAQGGLGARAAIRANRRAAQQQEKQHQRRQEKQQKQQQQEALPQGQGQRQQLQQQIRRTLWRVTKQRIGFNDEQMGRLEGTSKRYDQERRQLAVEEKAQRVTLRREILADSAANQSSIASALDRIHAIQQRRLDIQADEQKEFATFMTPLQRARFGALQEQVRKRLQEFERSRAQAPVDSLPTSP